MKAGVAVAVAVLMRRRGLGAGRISPSRESRRSSTCWRWWIILGRLKWEMNIGCFVEGFGED